MALKSISLRRYPLFILLFVIMHCQEMQIEASMDISDVETSSLNNFAKELKK